MTAITIEKFAGKMNRLGYDAFLQAMRQARGDGNRNVELSHWLAGRHAPRGHFPRFRLYRSGPFRAEPRHGHAD